MKTGKTLQDLAIELERQNEVKRDYIANTNKMQMMVPVYDEETAGPVLSLPDIPNFTINSVAHDQIGAKLGIPSRYYNRMLEHEPELLATNVNTWFQKEPDNRMIRTLDGKARAFLSDRYRRIDNHEIAMAVLPIISNMEGASVESCELTDKRMYLKVVNPRIQTEISKGDIVQSGILISNSETGLGAVSVMPLVYRLVCKNGMIANTAGKRNRHVGRSNEGEDNFEIYRSETIVADDKAFVMKLQDIVRATADMVQFERVVSAMKISKDAKITSSNVPAVVQLAAKSYGLFEKESESILDHLIRGEELSLYGLANAVTRHAQDVASYDRSTELEMTAWAMMNMERNEWTKLNAA
ncbi:MAG: DUF945 domain-containing protein [Spirochaetaceae bacterium]|jgi:hypothetical protein|nr:DUF945 domain-containing protein [Spirochaetaceae bacterium]